MEMTRRPLGPGTDARVVTDAVRALTHCLVEYRSARTCEMLCRTLGALPGNTAQNRRGMRRVKHRPGGPRAPQKPVVKEKQQGQLDALTFRYYHTAATVKAARPRDRRAAAEAFGGSIQAKSVPQVGAAQVKAAGRPLAHTSRTSQSSKG